jgi:hypothetical protein
MIEVTKLKYLGGHRLHATFSDGTAVEHDFFTLVAENGPMGNRCAIPHTSRACSWRMVRRLGRMVSICVPIGCTAKLRRLGRWCGLPLHQTHRSVEPCGGLNPPNHPPR